MADDTEADVTHRLLLDAASVYAVRCEVGPGVDAVISRLRRDPLGDDATVTQLSLVLGSDRVRRARRVRERLVMDLVPEAARDGEDIL